MAARKFPEVSAPGWGQNAPTWLLQAACAGLASRGRVNPFDLDDDPEEEAYWPSQEVASICGQCPVRKQCFDAGFNGNEHGIWGGTTFKQRNAIKRSRVRMACPACGMTMVPRLEDENLQVCAGCAVSWRTQRSNDNERVAS